MRRYNISAIAWLTIALVLISVPALPRIIPSANAVVGPTLTPWRPYGPYAEQVLATVYTNEISELAAFTGGELDFFDWTLPPAQIPALSAHADAQVSQPVAEAGAFQFDFNHQYPILGVTMQGISAPCTPATDGLFGGCSTKFTTTAGKEVKKALAHLVDKASFVNTTPLCIGGRCVAIDDQIPAAVCLDSAAPCSTFAARISADSGYPAAHGTVTCTSTPCAYRVAPGLGNGYPSGYCAATPGCWGGAAPPPGTDVRAAWEHLKAAGILDSDADGLLDTPANGQTIFAIRSDDTRRRDMGIIMTDALDSLFERPGGTPVSSRLFGNIAALGAIVFTNPPLDDFGVYTGGWGLSLDATHLWPLYDSAFGSDICGGLPSSFNLNYGFYCNNDFDLATEQGTFNALTIAAFNGPHQTATNVASDDLATMPMFSRASRTLHHSGWDGILDVKGDGYANTGNWFSARAKAGYTGQYGGAGGNPDPDLLRAGFRQGTSKLNIFHAGTVWESYVVFNVLDGLTAANPRSATAPFFDQYETGATSVQVTYTTFQLTGALTLADAAVTPAPTAPVTMIDIIMRDDLFFHDGVNLEFDDFLKTGLALKDVPQGGFGGAASWAPLLAYSDPIPGSNCAPYCGRVVFDGQTFLHELNTVGTAILPIHLWDSNGDGFVCGALGIGSCTGLPVDPTTDINYDPMANGIMVGHGPWRCLDTVTGTVGGSCSETAAGVQGGQSIAAGGRFIFNRYDGYYLGAPTLPGSPICNFATADVNNDWRVDGADLALAVNTAAEPFVLSEFDHLLGGTQGKNLNEVDTTNTGNLCPDAIA